MCMILWHCTKCGSPIYKGQTARVDRGRFYHVYCWRKSPPTEWFHAHASPYTEEVDHDLSWMPKGDT